MEELILPSIETKLLLAIDEADRLLNKSFRKSFFSLLTFWHNKRYEKEKSDWEKLSIVVAISTEINRLIDDVTVSPSRVGLKIELEDFNEAQVEDLNNRYQSPMKNHEIIDLMEFLNGHPYLTHRAIYTMFSENITWDQLKEFDRGVFIDDLRHYSSLLSRNPHIKHALNEILKHNRCPDDELYYRLLQAGLIKGQESQLCWCRCKLFEQYLTKYLQD